MRRGPILIYLLVLGLLLNFEAVGQIHLTGRVLDSATLEPLSFVSIGIPETQFGAISNEDGSFELLIAEIDAPLIFSYVGHEKLQIQTSTLESLTELEVLLRPIDSPLDAVVVTADQIRPKQWKLGNHFGSSSIVLSDSLYSGAEIALKITLRKSEIPVYIKEVHFKIRDNKLDEAKARPRFYHVDAKTGQPGEEITSSDQIIRSEIQTGWIKVEVDEALEVSGDFFISIEWLFDKDDRRAISRSYHDFKTYHAGLIQTKYAFVDGKRVSYEDFGGNLKVGWSISCSTEPSISSRHSAFIRYNSFGSWHLSTAVPVVQVLVAN